MGDRLESQAQVQEAAPSVQLPARYEILEVLGKGGAGIVLRAIDRQLDREVAVKVLSSENSSNNNLNERFLREAKILAFLDHTNIVKLLTWNLNENNQPYLVMEYLKGLPLTHEIAEREAIRPSRFYQIFSQLLRGLEYAHERGVLHRDLKPSNIILLESEGAVVPKIVDFGIAYEKSDGATVNTQSLTKTGFFVGSPNYMSPEQCRGEEANVSSDIYSLACVMYEYLLGHPPVQGETAMDVMYKKSSSDAYSLESVASSKEAKELGHLIDLCLSRDAAARPSSARELREALDKIFLGRHIDTRKFFASVSKGGKHSFTGKAVLIAASSILIAGGSCLVFFSAKTSKTAKPTEEDILPSKVKNAAVQIARWQAVANNAEIEFKKNPGNINAATSYFNKLHFLYSLQFHSNLFREAESTVLKMSVALEAMHLKNPLKWRAEIKSRIAELRALSGIPGDLSVAQKYLDESVKVGDKDVGNAARIAYVQAIIFLKDAKYSEAAQVVKQLAQLDALLQNDKDGLQRRADGMAKGVGVSNEREPELFLKRFAKMVCTEKVARGNELQFIELLNSLCGFYEGKDEHELQSKLLKALSSNLKLVPAELVSGTQVQVAHKYLSKGD
jgi:serine/threonine protein kinase